MSQKNKQYDLEYYADLIGKTDHMIDPENGLSYHREGEVWIPDASIVDIQNPNSNIRRQSFLPPDDYCRIA